MKATVKDLLITTVSVTAIAAAGTALYRDFTGRMEGSKTEQIGTITFKKKTAQRKYSGQVIWENLNQSDAVYNHDTIRTDEDSISIIKLRDGSRIELNENTLILLSLTENKTTIDFSQGSINAAGGGNLDITAGKTVISAGGSSINLSKSAGDRINLNVNSGSATLGDKKIAENQEAVIGAESALVSDREFIPAEPMPGAYILAFGDEKNIRFAWKSKLQKKYILEIARDASFTKKITGRYTARPEAMVRLKSGTWFWRTGYAEKNGKKSAPWSLNVVREKEELLLAPAVGQVFSYVTTPPLVPLQWSGSTAASSYTIEVAADPGFKNIIKTVTSRDRGIALDGLGPGNYFWRVTNIYPFPVTGPAITSNTRSFSIKQGTALTPPELLTPPEGHRLSNLFLSRDLQVFSWKSGDEMKEQVIKIDRDRAFKNPLISSASPRSFYQLSGRIEAGTYYWLVEGKDSQGNVYRSVERSFTVTDAEKITTISPVDGGSLSLPQGGASLRFSWNDPNRAGSYRLEISDSKDFSRIISSYSTGSASLSVKNIPRGPFFWRIAALGKDGNPLLWSNTASASTSEILDTPAAIVPVDGSTIDMTYRNDVTFSWKKVPGATRYRLIINQYAGGFTKKVLETETTGTAYVLKKLELLDEGNFSWEISALRYDGERLERESIARKSNFSLTLKDGTSRPEIISPKNLYKKDE